MLRSHWSLVVVLGCVALHPGAGLADEPPKPEQTETAPLVFDRPGIDRARSALAALSVAMIQAGNLVEAQRMLEQASQQPELDSPVLQYNLTCVLALQGKTELALTQLEKAVKSGYINLKLLDEDTDLIELRKNPKFSEIRMLAETASQTPPPNANPPVTPRKIEGGIAEVGPLNTQWRPDLGMMVVLHEFPPPDPNLAISKQGGAVGDLLRQWSKEGTAAGLHGVLYDNHDRDHSNMSYDQFPQLTRVEYCEEAKLRQLDFGLQAHFGHNAPLIGNASVAMTSGPFWRSMTRLALSQEATARVQLLHYLQNQLYFYPEHNDHDENYGDVFHANTPFVVTSQGSSGSDREFMDACMATTAAFSPETQQKIFQAGLLAPTLQMILRRSLKGIETPEDYLTGAAHPSVFDGTKLDPERMVRLAHSMAPGEIPPLAVLTIEHETPSQPGVDYFEPGSAEAIFTTPVAISRMVRSTAKTRSMTVSVAQRKDLNNLPLTFEWRLLRGDPALVRIKPLGEKGDRAEIEVDWAASRPLPGDPSRSSFRVDVAVFAFNGHHYSAPSFISWAFPQCEERTYHIDGRIESVTYHLPKEPKQYTDPMLYSQRAWKDEYRYSPERKLLGWHRTFTPDQAPQDFTAQGLLVQTQDAQLRPLEAISVVYQREQSPNAAPVLKQVTGPKRFTFTYSGETDLIGTPTEQTPPVRDTPSPPQ
jgi:hypothetical protein